MDTEAGLNTGPYTSINTTMTPATATQPIELSDPSLGSGGGGCRCPNPLNCDVQIHPQFVYRLRSTRHVFHVDNPVLADVIESSDDTGAGVVAFVDQAVAGASDVIAQLERYAGAYRQQLTLVSPIHTVQGGEACKNNRDCFDEICQAMHDAGVCRHSYVMAIGGGAVLDAVGFAATIVHRGVRLIRLPTTTLGQCDSGVGVKNGINAFGKKNFLGTYCPPWAVINDPTFLTTLLDRDWRCGFSEAVKVALLQDPQLFYQIADQASGLVQRDEQAAIPILDRCAQLHLQHIVGGQDPFEQSSSRSLDFGHWAGHKLEQMTGFELRHGEAVAIGIALDVTYSALAGFLAMSQAKAIVDCLASLGFTLHHRAMHDAATLLLGLDEFREHLGGRLTVTLLSEIGQPRLVNEINLSLMTRAIEQLMTESSD